MTPSLSTPPRVVLESRFGSDVRDALRQLGHDVSLVSAYAAGGSVMPARATPHGSSEAAADPRDGGQALAV